MVRIICKVLGTVRVCKETKFKKFKIKMPLQTFGVNELVAAGSANAMEMISSDAIANAKAEQKIRSESQSNSNPFARSHANSQSSASIGSSSGGSDDSDATPSTGQSTGMSSSNQEYLGRLSGQKKEQPRDSRERDRAAYAASEFGGSAPQAVKEKMAQEILDLDGVARPACFESAGGVSDWGKPELHADYNGCLVRRSFTPGKFDVYQKDVDVAFETKVGRGLKAEVDLSRSRAYRSACSNPDPDSLEVARMSLQADLTSTVGGLLSAAGLPSELTA